MMSCNRLGVGGTLYLHREDGAGGQQRGVNLLQVAWPVTLLRHSSLANVNIVQDMMGKKMRTPSTNIISSRSYFMCFGVYVGHHSHFPSCSLYVYEKCSGHT